jgi:aminomethyltransferase
MNKTILFEEHLKLNAKMVPFAGFEMPVQYTSVKDEAIAVRNNVGVFDVSHMGEFFVEGPGAHDFVDFLITNDFKNAALNKAVYSPLCRENGTVIDDLIAYKLKSDQALICVNAANIQKDWDWISQHTEKFNCTLTNQSNDYGLLAIQGPNSTKLIQDIGIKLDENFEYYSADYNTFEDNEIIIARTGYTGEDGFEVFCKNEKMATLWNKVLAAGATPCGLASRDVLRLEVCYPLYGHELSDEWTPLDAALKWTVKLNKDSFIGKQALSEYNPKLRLIKLKLEKGIPREGYPILDANEKEIGKVTSGTMSVALGSGVCLGLVQRDQFPEDKKFFVSIRNKKYEAIYCTKPFVTGGHK